MRKHLMALQTNSLNCSANSSQAKENMNKLDSKKVSVFFLHSEISIFTVVALHWLPSRVYKLSDFMSSTKSLYVFAKQVCEVFGYCWWRRWCMWREMWSETLCGNEFFCDYESQKSSHYWARILMKTGNSTHAHECTVGWGWKMSPKWASSSSWGLEALTHHPQRQPQNHGESK